MKRIQSIDGLRAVSIIMVLIAHSLETMPSYLAHSNISLILANSALGVRIFFVISGFLITKLLIIERENTGRINIKDFYVRRIFRIFPVFYLYILVILILKVFFIPNIFHNYWLVVFAATFLWNYKFLFKIDSSPIKNDNWFFGHFWTLSLEEQFYMFWPLAFSKLKITSLKKFTIFLMFLIPFLRLFLFLKFPGSSSQIYKFAYDSILIGCLAALFENTAFFNIKVLKPLRGKLLPSLICVYLFFVSPLIANYAPPFYKQIIAQTIDNIGIVFLLIWVVNIKSLASKFLNNKLLVRIGVLSYSLYIWQQIFLTNRNDFWVNKFPQNIIIVVVVGVVSYYCIEKPILRLKKRFNKPQKEIVF